MTNDKFAFVYDATGNLLEKGSSYTLQENNSKVSINPNEGEHWLYHYDLLNRLVKVEQNGEVVANYKYDEAGLRLSKQTKEQTTYYIFNLNGQVIYEQEDTDYTEYLYVFNRHFARIDGNLLTEERTTYFYHTDHLGSTVLVTDEHGQTVWNSEYTPFGQVAKDDPGFNKAIKFTGKDLDLDIGLYYFNARWYDSDIGRFISEDPIKDGLNWYTYAISNPLRFVDPIGLWNEESRWYKPWTWLNAPNSEENTLGQLALDIQWQMINSGDSSQYIASFQGATGIKETGRINDETAELLDTYGQWYLMNNNLTLSDYMLAKWKQTDEQLFWRLTNSEYQRLKLIDDLYTIYSIYSLASLGFDAYKEIAVARQMHLQPRVKMQPKVNSANGRINLQLFSEQESTHSNVERIRYRKSYFRGTKVFQRNDLFDPNSVSSWKVKGKTVTGSNIERMISGRAPIGYDGMPINLHHLIQTNSSALAEVSQTFHRQHYFVIHLNHGQLPSGIDRAAFNQFRSLYWIERAKLIKR